MKGRWSWFGIIVRNEKKGESGKWKGLRNE